MAIPANSCDGSAIIDYLAHQPPGTFTLEVLKFNDFIPSWWSMRVKQVPYPMHLGPSPLRRVQSRQRGGEVFNASVWHPSNGSGSAADNIAAGQPIGTPANKGCCPPVNNLKRGYLNRTITTFNWAWQGRLLCAADMDQSLDPVGDLEMEFQGYGMQIDQSKAMFQRNEYFRLCTTKLYARPGPDLAHCVVRSTVGDPTLINNLADANGVQTVGVYKNYIGLDTTIVPTSTLTQSILTAVSAFLTRNGIKGVTSISGAQQFELVTGLEQADALLRDATNQVYLDYAEMGKGMENFTLLAGLGKMATFRNIAYQIDPYALHLDANYDPVPATISVTAVNGDGGSGTEDVTNPAYPQAPYAVSFIYTDEVFNVAYPNTASSPGGDVSFMPYTYKGDLIFHRLPEVPLQDQGYFYSSIRAASFAGQQRFGVAIIHLNCNATSFRNCAGDITTY